MTDSQKNIVPAVILMIALGALMRVLPHPVNVAPVAALALFGGAYLPLRYALLVPLLAMVGSDLLIGFDFASMPYVYGMFMLTALLGYKLGRAPRLHYAVGASVVASIGFYLVTNLVWIYPVSLYPQTWAGQLESYAMALPFFRNSLLGDVGYTFVFFGAYALIEHWAHSTWPTRVASWAFGRRIA